MTWYSEQDNQELPIENRSLVIAFANLLQRYDYEMPPTRVNNLLTIDDPTMDFWSLPRVCDGFQLAEFAEGESWPATNVAIVKQRRLDESQAGMVDHYSLVADQRAKSIIDSLDGKIKNANEYGQILSWASYTYDKPEDEEEEAQTDKDENIHVLAEGENLWDVSRSYNVPIAALIAENDIEDPVHLPVGTELYIPDTTPRKDNGPAIHYELFDLPRPMHVIRTGGAKKWSFGGVTKWADLYSTGRLYPYGMNVDIVAVAHVPIGSEKAAYYLDSVSLGDYRTTGLPRYTSGFNWQHLGEGHVVGGTPPVPEATIEQVVADAMQEEDRPDLIPEAEATDELIITTANHVPSWKDTFKYLNAEKKSETFMFNEPLVVNEVEGKLSPKSVGKFDEVRIIGTFEKEGVLYGRAAVRNFWYGVPMDKLTNEDSLYNTDMDLPTRIAMRGQLSSKEKRLVILSKAVSRYTNMLGRLKHK